RSRSRRPASTGRCAANGITGGSGAGWRRSSRPNRSKGRCTSSAGWRDSRVTRCSFRRGAARTGYRSASSAGQGSKWSSRERSNRMATELQQMIDVVAKDKGIDPSIVIGAIEDAYLAASRKVFKGDEDLRTRFNPDTGLVELYAVKQIVEEVTDPAREISIQEAQELYGEEAEVGMQIEFPKDTERLGRIAAQTAKQVIAQRVREAEREKIHAEYSERIGEVVTATVKR